jgi:hypothetical protein
MSKQKLWIVAADTQDLESKLYHFCGWIVRICSSFEKAENTILKEHIGYVKIKEGIYKVPNEHAATLKLFEKEIDEIMNPNQSIWIVAVDIQDFQLRLDHFCGWIVGICSSYEKAENIIFKEYKGYAKVKEGVYKVPNRKDRTLKLFKQEIDEIMD